MRDVLEELLDATGQEEEGGVLEQLLRPFRARAGNGANRAQITEEARAHAPEQPGERAVDIPQSQEELAQWWEETPEIRLEQEDKRLAAAAARLTQGLSGERRVTGGAAEDSAARQGGTAPEADFFRSVNAAPALARELEQRSRATVRAAAAAGDGNAAARGESRLGQHVSGSAVGGAREIDRAFERDARRYDSRFYLY